MERKKNQKLKVRNEGQEKMNWTAVTWTYMAVLPTDSPTDIKLIIILIYSVGDMLKIRRQSLNFAPKFLITLHIFRGPSVIPLAILRGQRRIKCATLWNSRSPSVILSVKLNHRQLTDVFKFVGVSVGDVVAFQVIIFELSVKCRRT